MKNKQLQPIHGQRVFDAHSGWTYVMVAVLVFLSNTTLCLGDGLQQYWPFNDSAGTTASNAVSGGNAGTLVNYTTSGWSTDVPAALADRANGSLAFASASGHYVDGGHIGLSVTGGVDGVTLSLWLKPGVIGADTRLFSMLRQTWTSPHAVGAIRLMATVGGQGTLQIYNGSTWVSLTSSGAIQTNQWQQLCFVWRGTQFDIYLNGDHAGTASCKLEFDLDTNGDPGGFGIGAMYWTCGTTFDGKIADMAVWNETLSPVQVRRLAAGESPLTIHLVDAKYVVPLYWAFDDGAGSTATNSVSGGNTGTLVNFNTMGWNSDVPDALAGRSSGSLAFTSTDNAYVNGGYLGISSTGGVDGVTISCWLKPDCVSADMRLFTALRNTLSSPHPSGQIRLMTNTLGQITMQVSLDNIWAALTPAGAIQTNRWQHLCLTWRASEVYAYLNGTLVGWTLSDFDFYRDSIDDLVGFGIGAKYMFYGQTFDGKIDDLAIWNMPFSDSQIHALALGISPLDVSFVAECVSPEKPLVQYRLDGNAYASPRLYDGVTVSGATFTNGIDCTPFDYAGAKSLLLDGVNGEVTLPNADTLRPGTNAWTLSMWFNAPTNAQQGTLIANRSNTGICTQIGIYFGGDTTGTMGFGRKIQ